MKELLGAIIVILLLGGLVSSPKHLENKIEKTLQQQLKTHPGNLKVNLRASNFELLSGDIDGIDIEVSEIKIERQFFDQFKVRPKRALLSGKVTYVALKAEQLQFEGIPIDMLSVKISGIKFDLWKALIERELQIIRAAENSFDLTIREETLCKLLSEKLKGIEGLKVKIMPDNILVAGKYSLGFLPLNIRVSGKLRLIGSSVVKFDISTTEIYGIKSPEELLKPLLTDELLSLDIEKILGLPIKLKKIIAKPGKLTLYGSLPIHDRRTP